MPSLAPPVAVKTDTTLCLQGSIRANVGLQGSILLKEGSIRTDLIPSRAPPIAIKTATNLCLQGNICAANISVT